MVCITISSVNKHSKFTRFYKHFLVLGLHVDNNKVTVLFKCLLHTWHCIKHLHMLPYFILRTTQCSRYYYCHSHFIYLGLWLERLITCLSYTVDKGRATAPALKIIANLKENSPLKKLGDSCGCHAHLWEVDFSSCQSYEPGSF